MAEERPSTAGQSRAEGSSAAWSDLASDYERARSREDSLDRLVEWPAQRELLGEVRGLRLLDLGCGSGSKLAELVDDGAGPSVGVDITGRFIDPLPSALELVQGDLNALDAIPELEGRSFDRILFLQSFGYATDTVEVLRSARSRLASDGFILLTRTHPIRYAVERATRNGTGLGEAYFSKAPYTYRTTWNPDIELTKRPYAFSDVLNEVSAARLSIETAAEPQLSDEARRRHPHKQAWMDQHLGMLIFRLRPLPD